MFLPNKSSTFVLSRKGRVDKKTEIAHIQGFHLTCAISLKTNSIEAVLHTSLKFFRNFYIAGAIIS